MTEPMSGAARLASAEEAWRRMQAAAAAASRMLALAAEAAAASAEASDGGPTESDLRGEVVHD